MKTGKKKLKLENLKIESFVTSLEKSESATIFGGDYPAPIGPSLNDGLKCYPPHNYCDESENGCNTRLGGGCSHEVACTIVGICPVVIF